MIFLFLLHRFIVECIPKKVLTIQQPYVAEYYVFTLREYNLYLNLSISCNNICSINKYYSLVFDSKRI